ncbi:MAG: hypothetical protein IAG13_06190 [Deltaproteobacteria bacterium]|nr:hypothetical protein [Nannocystaceae bacterium]
MGLFGKRAVECDWCGVPIVGEGLSDGGLRLCSQACVDQKNSPPVISAAPTVPDLRAPSKGVAAAELAIAVTELELYQHIAQQADDEANGQLARAQQAYFGLWGHLEIVAHFLAARGAPLDGYRAHHRSFTETSDGSRHGREIGIAIFRPENVEHARAAIAMLQRAMGELGES